MMCFKVNYKQDTILVFIVEVFSVSTNLKCERDLQTVLYSGILNLQETPGPR